ncbi:MAG: amino acid ABC transporter ATP-binding protein [Fibrobacter sp.]|nr:amino acid ABC transporter ATP-binding protein [Fibrobacter sp.]
MISVKHLKKVYPGATPLSDVNCEIKKGEVISIIGPSGTGKSTFLRCLNRLETPTSGEIWVNGINMCDSRTSLPKVRKNLGMVFQSFNLFGHKTVLENVMMAPMDLLGKSAEEAKKFGMELLERVGLAAKASVYPDKLSGGQQQRVAIARALAMEPEILLFDEPTSALDPTMVSEVLSVIANLAKQGMTMIIVTHEMRFARDVSTRIFYMDEGCIYEEGTPKEIFDHPQKELTRNFIFKIKNWLYEIQKESFDFYEMMRSLEQFAERQYLNRKQILNLRLALEELLYRKIFPAYGSVPWHVFCELTCSEGGSEIALTLKCSGLQKSPLSADFGDRIVDAILCKYLQLQSSDATTGEFVFKVTL